MLEYLLPGVPKDVVESHPVSLQPSQNEGRRANLELLHPCIEDATKTKYGALFLQDRRAVRYRQAFFFNPANNPQHGQEDWLLDSMGTLADALLEDGLHDDSNLLREGARLIRARNHCYGCLQYPVCCTREVAWSVFRSAIANPGYYLSLQEFSFMI